MSFSNPESIIKYLALTENMKVADFGAGTGAYTKEAARRVGASGRVYAIEIQKELATRLKGELKHEGITNTEVIWGTIEKRGGSELNDSVIDAVILANTLFLVPDKVELVKEVARVLKPGGKLLLVDWMDSFGGIGPLPDMVVPPEKAQALFEHHGFSILEHIPESGDHHYGMIFVRA